MKTILNRIKFYIVSFPLKWFQIHPLLRTHWLSDEVRRMAKLVGKRRKLFSQCIMYCDCEKWERWLSIVTLWLLFHCLVSNDLSGKTMRHTQHILRGVSPTSKTNGATALSTSIQFKIFAFIIYSYFLMELFPEGKQWFERKRRGNDCKVIIINHEQWIMWRY